LAILTGWASADGAEIDVRQAQLFIDDEVIESVTLIERVGHQPIRYSTNPLLSAAEPWEGPTLNYLGGVYRDVTTDRFRAWYVGVVSGGVPGMPEVYFPICTAESDDGVHWYRPKLDTYAHLTGGPNNIVLHLDKGCTSAPSILYTPEDSERPWKLIIHHSPGSPCHYFLRLATSKDGYHWRWETDPEAEPPTAPYAKLHDRMAAMHDPCDEAFPYLILSRPSLSRDYPLIYPGRIRVREVFQTRLSADGRTVSGTPAVTLRPDLEDSPDVQFYHMNAYRYASVVIGSIFIYRTTEPPRAEVQLAVTRDLEHWQRVRPRAPFFSSALEAGRQAGIWDAGGPQPTLSPPIRHNGALWIYYLGGPAFHGSRFLKGELRLGLAKLRPDGFASLRADWREGSLTTKPFVWPGGKLVVNCQSLGGTGTRGDAWVKTAILNEDGKPVTPFLREASDPIDGDFPETQPRWSGKDQDLDPLIGKKIRLRFFLRHAEIFSFRSRTALAITGSGSR